MSSAGTYLRELREAHGLSLEEVARATRVGSPQLAALEADDYAALPAPVFIKGFIRAYCQALGELPSEALTRFDQAGWTGAIPTTRGAVVVPRMVREPRRSHVLVSLLLFVMLGVALAMVTLALRPRRDRAEPVPAASVVPPPVAAAAAAATSAGAPPSPAATSTSPGATLSLAPAGSPSGTPMPPGPGIAATRPAAPGELAAPPIMPAPVKAEEPRRMAVPPSVGPRYRLVARTSEATWIRVRTEEGTLVEETIPAGQVREWRSNAPLVLTVGNAGGIALELNGRSLAPLGERGVVVRGLVVPGSGS